MGGLRPLAVCAGRLAQGRRVPEHVQQVVLNLESQADWSRKTAQCLVQTSLERGYAGRRHQHAGADQRTRLAGMHLLHLRDAELLALHGEINRLTSGHAKGAARLRQ